MVIVKLQGGLGNQMFQYAIGRAFAVKHGVELYLDTSFFEPVNIQQLGSTLRKFELDCFKLPVEFASPELVSSFLKSTIFNRFKKLAGLSYKKKANELHPGHQSQWMKLKSPVYLEGFWQSEEYFKCIESDLRKDFHFQKPLHEECASVLQVIKHTCSVGIHIRRGDYILNSFINRFHGICGKSYYAGAIKIMQNKLNNCTFFVFTDMPEMVKNELADLEFEYQLVDCNSPEEGWKDMQLMSNCQHQIIANSSFSWWAAWLNTNDHKIVIAPQQWFADESMNKHAESIVPESWIKI